MRAGGEEGLRAELLDHVCTATWSLGKYDEARPACDEALAIRERLFGPDSTSVATILNSVGIVAERQGKYDEARALHERALAIWTRAVGAEHPKAAMSLNNLGFGADIARRTQDRIERRFHFRFEEGLATSLAQGFDIPLLIIHDLKDSEVPYTDGAQLVEKWPKAELMNTIGLGHLRILSAPAVVRAAVGFLDAPDSRLERGNGSREINAA